LKSFKKAILIAVSSTTIIALIFFFNPIPAEAAFGIDGSVHGNVNGVATIGVNLTTTQSNDVIIVSVLSNVGPVTSVTAPGLTFTYRTNGVTAAPGANIIEQWRAVASSPFSGTITVNTTGSGYTTVDAFGVSGVDTAVIYDSNASLPARSSNGSPSSAFISTTASNTFIIGAMNMVSTANPGAGSGWTLISGAHYTLMEYKIVTIEQTNLQVTEATGQSHAGSYGDAMVPAAVAAAPAVRPKVNIQGGSVRIQGGSVRIQ
jgi:hypothetical protein